MSAREEMIKTLVDFTSFPGGVADEVLQTLASAGYRILAPGELDRRQGHICGCPEMGTYEGQVTLIAPDWLKDKWPNGIGVDVCLALEIQHLWKAGIRTSGHCCGHGRAPAFISVLPESIDAMKTLGYSVLAHPDGTGREDHFVPKTPLATAIRSLLKEPEGKEARDAE